MSAVYPPVSTSSMPQDAASSASTTCSATHTYVLLQQATPNSCATYDHVAAGSSPVNWEGAFIVANIELNSAAGDKRGAGTGWRAPNNAHQMRAARAAAKQSEAGHKMPPWTARISLARLHTAVPRSYTRGTVNSNAIGVKIYLLHAHQRLQQEARASFADFLQLPTTAASAAHLEARMSPHPATIK